jgi:LuxR family maltose regulon positive regulatory protein
MRSWIAEAGLGQHAAWVPVDSQERDPRRFWISVADALRGTAAGSALVRPLTAAPDLDGWAVVELLLTDLASLEDRLWLVIDDAHLLDPGQVLPQLELLVLRAPPALRFFLATRHDLRLGQDRCPPTAGNAFRSCFLCCGSSWPGASTTSQSWSRRRSGCSRS